MNATDITMNEYMWRATRSAPTPLGHATAELAHVAEILNNAYHRDYCDPNLIDFRPDLEEWMQAQLQQVLSATAAVASALGITLGDIAVKDVTGQP